MRRMGALISAGIALTVVAANGGVLAAFPPGPAVVRALYVTEVMVFACLAAIAPFVLGDFAAERRLGLAEDHLVFVGRGLVLIPLAMAVVVIAAEWPALALTGTLATLAAARFGVGVVVLAAVRFGMRRAGVPIDDPALSRRLQRFAREAGLNTVAVEVIGTADRDRTLGLVPRVEIRGVGADLVQQYISVPAVLLTAPPGVIETDVARAIVSIRRRTVTRRALISTATETLVLFGVAIFFQDSLVAFAGAAGVDDPAFLPAAGLVVALARTVTLLVSSVVAHDDERHVLTEALDLTRDPASVDEAARYYVETWWTDHDTPLPPALRQLFGEPALSPREAKEIAAAWRSRQRVALLFTDVVGSTELVHELGDRRWTDILSDHDHEIRQIAAARSGREIDNPGDGFVFEFPDAGQAVLAAIDAQRAVADIEIAEGTGLPVRMGVHAGDVVRRASTIAGVEVHYAARVGAAGGAGDILVSAAVADELASSARFHFGTPRNAQLKGFEGEHQLVPVEWQVDEAELVSSAA